MKTILVTIAMAAMVYTAINGSAYASLVSPGGLETVEGDTFLGHPFTAPFDSKTQSLYPALDFSGPMIISGIGYRADSVLSAYNFTITDIQFSLSTFMGTVLDTNFAHNVGSDELVVFSRKSLPVTVSSGSAPNPFDFVVTFDSPFFYDPSRGDLLVEISKFSSEHGIFNFDAQTTSAAGTISGDDVYSGTGRALDRLLVAEFYGQIIPEPSSIAMIGLVGGCAVFVRRFFVA